MLAQDVVSMMERESLWSEKLQYHRSFFVGKEGSESVKLQDHMYFPRERGLNMSDCLKLQHTLRQSSCFRDWLIEWYVVPLNTPYFTVVVKAEDTSAQGGAKESLSLCLHFHTMEAIRWLCPQLSLSVGDRG